MRVLLFAAILVHVPLLFAADNFQPVNLNVASRDQIMILPGVGETLAKRIVEYRERKGQFGSLDDLLLIEGLRPKLLEKLSGKIEVVRAKRTKSKLKDEVSTKEMEVPSLSRDDIETAMKAFEKEPKVKAVQEQAIRYATAEPARVEDWLSRSRLAPSLPSLSLSGGKGVDYDHSVREKIGDPSVLSRRDSSDYNFNAKLEWRFADLVFNSNELRVAREAFRMAVLRERILQDVTKAYFERRKAQMKLALDNMAQPLERVEWGLKIEELTATLDGLTGGWFSEQVLPS